MNDKSFKFAIVVTVIWLIGVFTIYLMGWLEYPTSFNELGDFLAGIFSPVAFFWLIYGYFQQGKQLEQNTKALKQQKWALNNQEKNMKNRFKPDIEFEQCIIQLVDNQSKLKFTFNVLNNRVGDARKIKIASRDSNQSISMLRVDEKQKVELEILLKDFKWDFESLEYIDHVQYSDIFDDNYTLKKTFVITNNHQRLSSFQTNII